MEKKDHIIKNPDEGIYIVNKQYELLYMERYNRFSLTEGPRHKCYKFIRGKDAPCADCPMKLLHKNKRYLSNQLLYNEMMDCWIACSLQEMDWDKEEDCVLISIKKIVDKQRRLFLNLNREVKYEELFEFHIKENSYKILDWGEHRDGSNEEGKLDVFIRNLCFKYVYPAHQNAFLKFWNPVDMKQRVDRLGNISGEFRMLFHNREYRWISFYINPALKNNVQSYLCFTVNMDKRQVQDEDLEESQRMYQVLDPLTGLYNTGAFHEKVKERLANDRQPYGLVMIDIEHFKLFNDWYGTSEGDKLLLYLAKQIERITSECQGIGARIGGDDFIMLLPDKYCVVAEIEKEIIKWSQNYDVEVKFLPTGGIYLIEDATMSVTLMCDCAALALNSVKGNYATRVAMYQTSMKQKLENEQEILFGVKKGLDKREFVIYFQPQCSARTKRIVGAEALVRWNHPHKGLLPPGEFIPILETSGFIAKLDYYVWEEVCRFLHERIEKGLAVVPISVNVSRVDIYQYNITEVFCELITRYELDPKLVEIEITESAYTEDFHYLIQAVKKLRDAGFIVLMDDFGSGYSSLNMLKDIEIDILKIDMKFLEVNDNSAYKSSSILESIIQMGKWLGLHLIAEGVETKAQEDNLLSLDCEYMQGYFFYKPMSVEDFEFLLGQPELIDVRGILAKRLPSIELEDLFHKDITSEAMLSNILGGIAIYEVSEDGEVAVKMVNDSYYRMTGCNAVDLLERGAHISLQVHPDDLHIFWDILHRAEKSSALGASGTFRRYRLSGEVMWMHLNAFFLRKQGNKKVFYGAIQDYTTMMNLQKDMMRLLDSIPGDVIELRVQEDSLYACRVVRGGLAHLHGYEEEEYIRLLVNEPDKIIHPDDYDYLMDVMKHPKTWGNQLDIEFRTRTIRGDTIWVEQRLCYVDTEDGCSIYNALCTDITFIKNQEEELRESQEVLQKLLGISDTTSPYAHMARENKKNAAHLLSQSLSGGMIGGYYEEGFPIYFANEEIIRMLGYDSYEELVQGIDGKVENTIYEEDRSAVEKDLQGFEKEGDEYTTRYRMVRKDGSYIWVIDKGIIVRAEDGRKAIISICIDVNETTEALNQLEETREDFTLLNSLVPGGYHQCECSGTMQFLHISDRFLEMTKYSREDIAERFHNSFLEMIVEEDQARIRERIQNQKKPDVFSQHYRIQCADGIIWVNNQMRIIDNGDRLYLAGVMEDINDVIMMEERMETIIANTPGDVFSIESGKIHYHSYNLHTSMGYELEEYKEILARDRGKSFTDPRDVERLHEAIERATREHTNLDLVFRSITKHGETRYTNLKATYSGMYHGSPLFYGILIDASAAITKEQDLKVSRQMLNSIIHQANLNVWSYDLGHDTLLMSRQGWNHLSDSSLIGMRIEDDNYLITDFSKRLLEKEQFTAKAYHVLTIIKEKCTQKDFETSVIDLSAFGDRLQWLRITCEGIYQHDQLVHVIGYLQDVSEQMEKEALAQEEKKYAQMDSLTGIYNRRMGEILIQNALSREDFDGIGAILMIDLDDFKLINDRYGHLRGDHVLKGVAAMMKEVLEEDDIFCRYGGDEFLIYTHVQNRHELEKKLRRIITSTESIHAMCKGHGQLSISMSIGAALNTNHSVKLRELYDQADQALYKAKAQGKQHYQIYGYYE